MRYEVAAERLIGWPAVLPPPSDVFMPVVTDGRDVRLRGDPGVGTGRPAAVLVLVYPDAAGDARLVLIERTSYDGHHSGEVSFPGGKAESDDPDLIATALREAAEEVGLRPDDAGVRIVGQLDDHWIPVSDFRITPIVALAERRPDLVASPAEVVRILEPPLLRFLPDAEVAVIDRTVGGWPLRYGHYEVDGLSVWGATARILSQLGAVLGEPVTGA
jgi:8-oxo-dGTP pyrophosphatase MutT (NUDIX family)